MPVLNLYIPQGHAKRLQKALNEHPKGSVVPDLIKKDLVVFDRHKNEVTRGSYFTEPQTGTCRLRVVVSLRELKLDWKRNAAVVQCSKSPVAV